MFDAESERGHTAMSSDPYASANPPTRSSPAVSAEPSYTGASGEATARTVPPKSAVKFTRTAATWWALAVGALVLIILLVFIAQNTNSIAIHFLGFQWSSPIGVTFLLAAVGGAVITLLAGTARMFQLRRAAKHNLKAR
jgi:uncharacterized integral membrane protein